MDLMRLKVIFMVEFKTWKDNYIFLRDFGNCTCLNCHYGGTSYTDDTEEHTDSEYAHLFCTESITMVRLDLMMVCANWKHEETGIGIEDIGENNMWKLTDEEIDILDESDKKWSIEEIRELVNDKS